MFLAVNIIFLFIFYCKKHNVHFFLVGFLINLLMFSFFYLFENWDISLIVFLILLISINDITAYLSGKKLGRNKIFPKISPNKSLEGTLIGIISTIAVSIVYANFFDFDVFNFCIFGFLMAILGLIGDLFISSFKRRLKIKDISNILPGHGGILDRLDSYLFCLPFSIIFFEMFNIV